MAHRDLIAAATDYIKLGWPVFILGRSKRPVANCKPCTTADASHDRQACECLTCHGFYAATLNVERLKAMLEAVPYGLLAIRTGSVSGLLVVDIDPRSGGRLDPEIMTPTRAVRTGSDGWHLLYRHPGYAVRSRPLPGYRGVDIKCDGGYVVAPPSLHPDTGRPYRLAVDQDVEEVPPALRAAVRVLAVRILTRAGVHLPRPTANGGPSASPLGAGGISYPDKLLASNITAIERAPEGTRRRTIYGAARGVARMILVHAISHNDGVNALTDAGIAAGQTERDVRRAIEAGFRDEGLTL